MCERATPQRRVSSRPRWVVLYAVALSPLAALAVVEAVGLPHATRILTDCGLVLSTVIGMGWWSRANRAALDLQGWCECAPWPMTIRVIESRLPVSPERRASAVTVTADTRELVNV
jgi:hypothetical protein